VDGFDRPLAAYEGGRFGRGGVVGGQAGQSQDRDGGDALAAGNHRTHHSPTVTPDRRRLANRANRVAGSPVRLEVIAITNLLRALSTLPSIMILMGMDVQPDLTRNSSNAAPSRRKRPHASNRRWLRGRRGDLFGDQPLAQLKQQAREATCVRTSRRLVLRLGPREVRIAAERPPTRRHDAPSHGSPHRSGTRSGTHGRC